MSTETVGSEKLILATGGYDHTIKLWEAYTGVCVKTLQHFDSQVNALDITPDKTMLVACGYQNIRLYDMQSVNPVVNFEGNSKNVIRVGFEKTGEWMFTGGEDCRVRIYDINAQTPKCNRMFDCLTPINGVSLHPNQIEMAIGSQGGVVYLWDIRSDAHDHIVPEVEASVQDVAISPDGAYLAAVNNKGNCYIWNLTSSSNQGLSTLQPKIKIEAHKRYVLRCKFSPDSSLFVTTSGDGTARIWKTPDFSLWRELHFQPKSSTKKTAWVWDAEFSPDSRYLFTASSDCQARLWNLDSKELEREYSGHQKALTALSITFINL